MSKKILSVMLALVMVMSVFSVVSFAAVHVEYEKGEDIKDETGTVVDQEPVEQTQYWSLETDNEADADGKYTVDVVLETNYAVGPISFAIDAEGATLESAVEGAALVAATGFNADVRLDKANNIVYIVPDPAEEGTEAPVLAAGSVIATLTFALTADTATVALMNDAKLADNAGTLIAARPADGLLSCNTIIYGQRVIDENGDDVDLEAEIASVELGQAAAEPADLAVKSGVSGVVIDTTKTFGSDYTGVVYGFTHGNGKTVFTQAMYSNFLEVTNGGTWEITKSIYSKRVALYGTGTIISIKNSDGSDTGKKYLMVLFGDVTGDGLVDTADSSLMYTETIFGGALDLVQTLAANLYVPLRANAQNKALALYSVTTDDTGMITQNNMDVTYFDVSKIAAAHGEENIYNTYYQ